MAAGDEKKVNLENLDILKKQVELREHQAEQARDLVTAMELQGASAEEIAKAEAEAVKLKEQANKLVGKRMQMEITLSKEIKAQELSYNRLAAAGSLFMGALQKTQDLLKRNSDNISSIRDTMHVNTNEAKKLNKEFGAALTLEKSLQTNRKESASMLHEMNEAFGGMQKFTAKQAVDMAIMSKQLGISQTNAAQFSQMMFQSSGASAETSMHLLAGVKSLSKASGVKFDSVMQDISKSGKDTMNYFGKSADEMAIMAVQARKMGFELADMKDMSEGLLDVEGRLEKQMKFNMLTGKNINMDKATSLLLAGDEIGAMKEIQKQVGDTSNLRVHERKILEDMLGINLSKLENAEQLAAQAQEDADKKQEIAEIEQSIRDGQLEEFANKEIERQAAATAEERRANFEEEMLNKQADMIGLLGEENNLALILQGIQTAIQFAIVAQSIAAKVLSKEQKKSLATAGKAVLKHIAGGIAMAGKAVGSIFSAFGQIPFGLGIPLALVAVAGMYALIQKAKSTMSDGVIGPGAETVVSGPKGSIQLDKQDSMIVGTNLMGNGNGGSSSGGGNEELLRKMDELIRAVRANRVINVDGYQLNEAVHLEKIPAGMS